MPNFAIHNIFWHVYMPNFPMYTSFDMCMRYAGVDSACHGDVQDSCHRAAQAAEDHLHDGQRLLNAPRQPGHQLLGGGLPTRHPHPRPPRHRRRRAPPRVPTTRLQLPRWRGSAPSRPSGAGCVADQQGIHTQKKIHTERK